MNVPQGISWHGKAWISPGILAVAILERLKPFRESWLEDHQDTWTDLIHLIVNLSIIQFTATVLSRLGDWVPDTARVFPTSLPLWCQLILVTVILDFSLYSMHLQHASSQSSHTLAVAPSCSTPQFGAAVLDEW